MASTTYLSEAHNQHISQSHWQNAAKARDRGSLVAEPTLSLSSASFIAGHRGLKPDETDQIQGLSGFQHHTSKVLHRSLGFLLTFIGII